MTNILSMFANYYSNRLCEVWTRGVLRGRITSRKRRLLSARGAITLTREIYMLQKVYILQLVHRIFCRNSSLQAVCDTPIARITGCVSSLRI